MAPLSGTLISRAVQTLVGYCRYILRVCIWQYFCERLFMLRFSQLYPGLDYTREWGRVISLQVPLVTRFCWWLGSDGDFVFRQCSVNLKWDLCSDFDWSFDLVSEFAQPASPVCIICIIAYLFFKRNAIKKKIQKKEKKRGKKRRKEKN